MDCPTARGNGAELMVAYGAGRLAPEIEFALEEHLKVCSKCRDIAQAQRQVWSALDAWTPMTVSPDFNQALYQRITEERQSQWRWRRLLEFLWSWRPAMPVAAACAALIAAFLLKGPAAREETLPQPAEAPQIEQVERALDDMDMLKQLGVAAPRETPSAPEQI